MKIQRYSVDIVIAGGGISGVISAISAAEKGLQVLLVEKNSFLGGSSTATMLGEMNATSRNSEDYISQTGQQIIKNLMEQNAAVLYPNEPMSSNTHVKVDRVRYHGEYLKLVLDRMVKEKGIEVLFKSNIHQVKLIDQHKVRLVINTNYERIVIDSKVLIDATGNAECIYLLKGKTIVNQKQMNQPATLIFRIGGVDLDHFKLISIDTLNEKIIQGYHEGVLPGNILALSAIPGTGEITVNATRSVNVDHESIKDISRALIETREQINPIIKFLQQNIVGFEHVYLSSVGSDIGIRDRRKIIGVYELTGKDVIEAKKFSDAVALGIYPVDIHKNENGAIEFTELKGDGVYTIPYRSLITQEFSRIIVTGKCISADNVAFGSIRSIGTIMNIGEATGTAAHLAVKQNKTFHDLAIPELQNILRVKGMKI